MKQKKALLVREEGSVGFGAEEKRLLRDVDEEEGLRVDIFAFRVDK
jgi:hypothetical protein